MLARGRNAVAQGLKFGPALSARRAGWGFAWLVVLAMAPPQGAAADKAGKKRKTMPELPVAATVGEEQVYVAEVRDLIARSQTREQNQRGLPPALEAEALELAINRRLVAARLVKEGFGVGDDELALLLTDVRRKIEAQQMTFEDFLERHGFNEAMVERQLTWDVLWRRYVASAATDEALEKFFAAHHRDYDGTKLRVSHILLRVAKNDERGSDDGALADVVERAEKLRKQIVSGKLKFADAAAKHSAGASRRQGGDLGWVPRHDQMTEAFSRAAFALEQGDISPPVVDPFGVHLIQCTAIEAGRDNWQDVRRPLLEAWAKERFAELASAARQHTQVKYTSELPHFDPATRKLVGAKQ
jgi:parvulin-like peptidyl-prolyl isomerase